MDFILYFDYAAIIVFIFLILSIVLKKQLIGTSNKLFLLIIGVSLVATILDIVASMPQLDHMTLVVLNTFFFLARAAIALSLFFYACNLGKLFHRMKRRPWVFLLTLLPYMILMGCLIANFFNQMIFDYLPGPSYQRGDFAWVAYAIGYSYVFAGILILAIRRKYHLISQIIAVCGAFVLQISSSIFQYFVIHTLVEMFITAITLMTLSLFIESPEIFVDFKTKKLSFRSFTTDMQEKLDIREDFAVVLIHVLNTSALYNLYSHEKALRFIRGCTSSLAERAKKMDRSATPYYLGDGTFAILYMDRSIDEPFLKRVNEALSMPVTYDDISFQFEARTCLVQCPEDCNSVEKMIAFSTTFFRLSDKPCLDLAPYRLEKGNVLFELDRILEQSIREKSFSLQYQPIYSIKEKRFVSAEALLRLDDPKFGMIMPSLIIPYAENCGKIVQIGAIVLEKSFAFYSKCLRGKIDYLEINLSPFQLLDPALSEHILEAASSYGIKPHEIVFEITETAAVMENPTLKYNIRSIREAGYRIAIDDFGTGYSNLSRLTKLDIYVLKFDRSMTGMLEEDAQDDFFLGLFRLFQGKGMKILFEGVETKELADKLARMDADQIQGFYYSKAHKEEDILRALEEPITAD